MQDLVCTFSPASTVEKIKNVKVTCAWFWRENKDSNVLADSISGSHSLPSSLKEEGVWEEGHESVGRRENKSRRERTIPPRNAGLTLHCYQLPTAFPS